MTRQRAVPLAIAAALAVVLVAGGLVVFNQGHTGEKTTAKVTGCNRNAGRYSAWSCKGVWVHGGSLLEGGHVVLGTVDGAHSGQVGKTIDVRVHGGKAYVTSMRLPIILWIGAAICAGLGLLHLWRTREP